MILFSCFIPGAPGATDSSRTLCYKVSSALKPIRVQYYLIIDQSELSIMIIDQSHHITSYRSPGERSQCCWSVSSRVWHQTWELHRDHCPWWVSTTSNFIYKNLLWWLISYHCCQTEPGDVSDDLSNDEWGTVHNLGLDLLHTKGNISCWWLCSLWWLWSCLDSQRCLHSPHQTKQLVERISVWRPGEWETLEEESWPGLQVTK